MKNYIDYKKECHFFNFECKQLCTEEEFKSIMESKEEGDNISYRPFVNTDTCYNCLTAHALLLVEDYLTGLGFSKFRLTEKQDSPQ